MAKVEKEVAENLAGTLAGLEDERRDWEPIWKDLAKFILPTRYRALEDARRRKQESLRRYIVDGTGTSAARTLASGMQDGITSPARPWANLTVAGVSDDALGREERLWLEVAQTRMLRVMAETNFYNALSVLYLDYGVFGTASMLIYESFDDILTCYNAPLGEFWLGQGQGNRINFHGRKLWLKAYQFEREFGRQNCSPAVQDALRRGGKSKFQTFECCHLISFNPSTSEWEEWYWEPGEIQNSRLLRYGLFNEQPFVSPRWEVSGNDSYGTSPGMDALGDIKQLQHETLAKAKGLDRLVNPPVLAHTSVEHQGVSLVPGGITYVSDLDRGVVPMRTSAVPVAEMSADILDIRARIQDIFHNDLFRMISQLDTVRSAEEIMARKEERLILLGPVMERFKHEGLTPAVRRVFNITERAGLLPPRPPRLRGAEIEVRYQSILNIAQNAVRTAPIERLLAIVGNMAAIYPEARHVPNVEEMIRFIAENTGVPAKTLRSRPEVQQALAAEQQRAQMQAEAETAATLAPAAQQLSETDTGGGVSALQALMG